MVQSTSALAFIAFALSVASISAAPIRQSFNDLQARSDGSLLRREFDETHDLFGRELGELQARNPSPNPPTPGSTNAQTQSYMAAQKAMFTAEMQAQNKMQTQTTQEEFVQKMNNQAWKTASSGASKKIQRSYEYELD